MEKKVSNKKQNGKDDLIESLISSVFVFNFSRILLDCQVIEDRDLEEFLNDFGDRFVISTDKFIESHKFTHENINLCLEKSFNSLIQRLDSLSFFVERRIKKFQMLRLPHISEPISYDIVERSLNQGFNEFKKDHKIINRIPIG